MEEIEVKQQSKKSTGHGIRYGLLVDSVVLDGESATRFQALLVGLRDQFKPDNPVEAHLVDTMVVAAWRRMRLWAVQKAQLTFDAGNQHENLDECEAAANDPAMRVAMAFESMLDRSRALDTVSRYEIIYDKQYDRALHSLMKFRKNAA